MTGKSLRLLRLKYDRVLRQQLRRWPGLSQRQLTRRMRLSSHTVITQLEHQTFVGEDLAFRVLDAMMAELVEQATGVEVDYDPQNWGLPPEPLDRLDKPYHNRPRGPGGRWLPRDAEGSYPPPRPPNPRLVGPVAPALADPQLAPPPAGPSEAEPSRWRRPTGVPLTGHQERALSEEHAVLTGKYEREAEDLTDLDQVYQVAAAAGMEVVIEDDMIPEDMKYPLRPRESPAERRARESRESAARAYEFELSKEDLSC